MSDARSLRAGRRPLTVAGRCIALAGLLLCLWTLAAGLAQAQSQEPDLPTYAAWVREALAAARRGDRIGLEDAGGRLVATERVRLPDGSLAPADNAWLAAALRESPPDTALIAARLGALADALAQPPGAAPADALADLRDILANPPFNRPAEAPPPQWLLDFFDWLGRVLERLFRPLSGVSPATSNLVAWIIVGVGLALVLGVIAYLLLGLRRGVVREARAADDPEAHLTATTALDQAGELARGGDYRAAVRYLYLAALLRLDERNLLRYDRALTNREYLERVRDNPALRERLRPIVDTFDRVWYGHAALDADAFAEYRARVKALDSE